jgi:hypothetical protein
LLAQPGGETSDLAALPEGQALAIMQAMVEKATGYFDTFAETALKVASEREANAHERLGMIRGVYINHSGSFHHDVLVILSLAEEPKQANLCKLTRTQDEDKWSVEPFQLPAKSELARIATELANTTDVLVLEMQEGLPLIGMLEAVLGKHIEALD